MGELSLIETRGENAASDNNLNYLDLAQTSKYWDKPQPLSQPALAQTAQSENFSSPREYRAQYAGQSGSIFDEVGRGPSSDTWDRLKPGSEATPYYRNRNTTLSDNDQPKEGLLSSTSYLVFLGSIATGMAKGRGSLQMRAIQGLILAGAIEVGRHQIKIGRAHV